MKSAVDMAPLAKSAAEKALAIDPANSEAHSVLAVMAGMFDYDWNLAETHHRRAMAAELVPAMVRFRYAMYYLLPLRRVPEAIKQSQLGLETDPLSTILHYFLALCMYRARRYKESIEYARKGLEIDVNFYFTWWVLGLAQLQAGLTLEALTSLRRVVDLAPWLRYGEWALAGAYYRTGDHQRNQELVRKLAGPQNCPVGAAHYYAVIGEADAMFEALDVTYRERDPMLTFVQSTPDFDPYRADPRFHALLAQMNLA